MSIQTAPSSPQSNKLQTISTHALSPPRIWVSLRRIEGANLVILDAASRKEIRKLKLGGGSAGILIVPDGSRAFIAVSTAHRVVVLDLNSFELIGQIPKGKQPDGLAWPFARTTPKPSQFLWNILFAATS